MAVLGRISTWRFATRFGHTKSFFKADIGVANIYAPDRPGFGLFCTLLVTAFPRGASFSLSCLFGSVHTLGTC
jgi:hypothetical protein